MADYRLSILKINQNIPGIIIIELGGRQNEEIFSFKPGQYVMISYRNQKGLIEDKHAFSIASSPLKNNIIRLGIRIGGRFTQGLLNLKVGQEVLVAGPYGSFVFNEKKVANPVFIAGGIGITPFMSSLNYAADKMLPNKMSLIYSGRNRETTSFLEEIQELQRKNPNFSALLYFSDDSGRLSTPVLQNFLGSVSGKTFYLCGPTPFMAAVTDMLISLGVDKKQIKMEAFSMIPDQGFWPVVKNFFYALGFAAVIFLPILYFINHPIKINFAEREDEEWEMSESLYQKTPTVRTSTSTPAANQAGGGVTTTNYNQTTTMPAVPSVRTRVS